MLEWEIGIIKLSNLLVKEKIIISFWVCDLLGSHVGSEQLFWKRMRRKWLWRSHFRRRLLLMMEGKEVVAITNHHRRVHLPVWWRNGLSSSNNPWMSSSRYSLSPFSLSSCCRTSCRSNVDLVIWNSVLVYFYEKCLCTSFFNIWFILKYYWDNYWLK